MSPVFVKDKLLSPGSLAPLGSLVLLLGAFGFQYLGGLAPCVLCLWQRWPHAVAILIGLAGIRIRHAALAGLGGLSMLCSAGIAAFHVGVEQGLWEGTKSCSTSTDVTAMTAQDALRAIMEADSAGCSEAAWSMMGISMAGWNGIFSLGLAVLWGLQMLRLLRSRPGSLE
jgi:disulfide bond formation protein DsbB